MTDFDRQGFRAAFAAAQSPAISFDLYGSTDGNRWHPVASALDPNELFRLVTSISETRADLGLTPMAVNYDVAR